MSQTPISPLAFEVRRYDRERFVTTLFIPEDKRDAVLVLYAFNAEVARIKSLVREPLAGAIRLQWWRDAVNRERPQSEVANHPIASPLTRMLDSGQVPTNLLLDMVDAKERDLNNQPFNSLAEMVTYADATAGNLGTAALHALGVTDEINLNAARGACIAYALTGLARSVGAHLSQGWMSLPHDLLSECGIDPAHVSAKSDLAKPVRRLTEQAETILSIARKARVVKAALPVCLHGTLAQGHGALLKKSGWDPFDAALAKPHPMPIRLAWHSWLGRF